MGKFRWLLLFPVVFVPGQLVLASQWQFTPSLAFSEIYTDNINLDNRNREKALVTVLSPAIFITNRSRQNNGQSNLSVSSPNAGGTGFTGGTGIGGFGRFSSFGGRGYGGIYGSGFRSLGGGGNGSFGAANAGQSLSQRPQGGRMTMDLFYRMQNIISTQSSRRYDIRHQLQANTTAELIDKSVYLDARATAGQTLLDPFGRQALDNISNTGNRTNFYTFGVSPYWLPKLGGFADGEVRVSYQYVLTPDAQSESSHRHAELVDFHSGHRFNILTWRANFRNEETNFSSQSSRDVLLRNGFAEVRYRWTRKISTFVQGGFNDSDFSSRTNTNQTGLFYTVGVSWRPNRMFMLEGGYGRNRFLTLRLNPTSRTVLEGTYMHNKVGTNTGNVWRALIRHRSRRTVWMGRYFEDTTTSQSVLANQQVVNFTDALGNPVNNPNQQPSGTFIGLPVLIDEAILRKRGVFSFSGHTAKNTFTARAYAERRQYQVSDRKDKVYGIRGSWIWRWGRRTSSLISMNWQYSKFNFGPQETRTDSTQVFWTSNFRLTRQLSPHTVAYLEYRHQAQVSKQGDSLDYDENRVVAAINMQF